MIREYDVWNYLFKNIIYPLMKTEQSEDPPRLTLVGGLESAQENKGDQNFQ